jgi:hypothetical protein
MTRETQLIYKFATFSFTFFCLEILFGGAGEFVEIFGLSIRYILFLTTVFLLFLLKLIQFDSGRITNDKMVSGLFFISFVAIWVFLLPLVYGQGITAAIKDSAPLLGACAIVLFFDEKNIYPYWIRLRKIIFLSLILFLLLHVSLYVLGKFDIDEGVKFSEVLKYIWEPDNFTIEKFVFIIPNERGLRIYFGSSFLLLIGLYFSFFYNEKYKNVKKMSLAILFTIGFIATDTRSLVLAAIIFFALVWILRNVRYGRKIGKKYFSLLLALPLVGSLLLVTTVGSDVSTSGSFSRGESDLIRPQQMSGLLDGIISSPIIGRGFGASVDPVRNVDAPYSYELSILALYMKIGMAGIAAVIIFLTLYLYSFVPNICFKKNKKIIGIYALYCSIILASFYNPLLFGFFGTFFIAFICLELKYISIINYHD